MSQSGRPCRAPIVIRGSLTESTHVRNCPAAAAAKGLGHGP